MRRLVIPALPLLFACAAFAQAPEQPSLTAVRSDFIPGEKTIFYDDFSDMAGDEPPAHWKVRGGTAELRLGAGVRQLTLPKHNMTLTANLQGLPSNFTLEVDNKFEGAGGNGVGGYWRFKRKDGNQALMLSMIVQLEEENPANGVCHLELVTGDPTDNPERLANPDVKMDPRQPAHFALWVQDGRIRVYANGERVIDVNQVKFDPIASMELQAVAVDDNPQMAMGLRRVRFAESVPDFSKTILASGRFITHAILFDTDSDRIRPESAPAIRQIARTLESNPGLKLLVEGHTDSTGTAERNMDLSKRRAEAVKAVLVAQFGVEAGRLSVAGLGATRPLDSSGTPAARAQNRRVEFVRQ